ncbi:hypothetical protein RCG67_07095 [Kocuria sp. CPCC 205292]|uniref:hypothetical protein n=1 Tax=Kocuria cellulosilytica TaxID=3071451 RepID=UPI0034D4FBA3
MEQFSASWRTLALTSAGVNFALLATVGVVGFVTSSDGLSTVALSLAIVAFVCQLIIYTVQTWQGSRQLEQARELNSATESMLAEARARIAGTNELVSAQHKEFIRIATLRTATAHAKDSTEHGEEPVSQSLIEEAVERVASDSDRLDRESGSREGSVARISRGVLQDLVSWPSDEQEVASSLEILNELSDHELSIFVHNLGIIPMRDEGAIHSPTDDALIERGLVEEVAPVINEGEHQRQVRPTEMGFRAGRVLLAPWPLPKRLANYSADIWATRERASKGSYESTMNFLAFLAKRVDVKVWWKGD